ncbi:MAG: hypothetical protein J6D03_06660 [Clostridia bacterium]|nr:hypothetical protein [Clostridia bacterium]
MGKIKVGELVRTVFGDIYKVKNLNDYEFLRDKFYNYIVKHSKNIIDLIEEGDLVNEYKVINFDLTYFNGVDRRKEQKRIGVVVDNGEFKFKNYIKQDDIKTILTKEKFESECFRLKEGQDV